MPHQCTECGRTFPDGSKEMLSGCPDCGGNKFQFHPGDVDDPATDPDESPPDRPGGVADRVGRATAAVKSWMSRSDDDPTRGGDGAPTADDAASPGDPTTADGAATADHGVIATDDTPTDTDEAATAADDTATVPEDTATATDDPATAAADGEQTDGDDRAYGEWPNPDGVDTSGVGKGPEDRGSPGDAADRDDDADDRADAVEGSTRPGETGIDAGEPADEDTAQRTARSDVVSPDELPDDPPDSGTLGPRGGVPGGPSPGGATDDGDATVADDGGASTPGSSEAAAAEADAAGAPDTEPPTASPEDGRVASEPADERPDLEDLREELNDQFESIRIVEPGQYELNLMELYDREEYIISLQEDGRYVIEVPERWRDEE